MTSRAAVKSLRRAGGGTMATRGFIYDAGTCVARIDDDGRVFNATTDGRQIATIDQAGNITSLQGELVGHLEPNGSFGGPSPEAFKKLLNGKD